MILDRITGMAEKLPETAGAVAAMEQGGLGHPVIAQIIGKLQLHVRDCLKVLK